LFSYLDLARVLVIFRGNSTVRVQVLEHP